MAGPTPSSKLGGNWRLLVGSVTYDASPLGLTKPGFAVTSGKTLAEWGFSNARLRFENLAPDTLTVTRALSKFDETPLIPYGALVQLVDPTGKVRFLGTRVVVPASASSDSELQTYEFVGPWYWLQRIVYRQTWKQLLINGALIPRTTSHLLLNPAGLSIAGQVQAVANFAIEQGAPFTLGTVDIPVVPFVTEITDQNCAQVIADQLRFAPDAVTWFDYSAGVPTFNCRRATSLSAVSLGIGSASPARIADEGITIVERPDNQVTSVSLRYERTDELNGKQYLALGEDIYPVGSDGSGLNAVHATITLAGYSKTTVQGSIKCEDIDTTSPSWWRRVIPRLNDPRVKNLVVGSVQRVLQGSRTDATPAGEASSSHERMLVEGSIADWMVDATDQSLAWEQEEISAEFSFDLDIDASDTGVKLEKVTKLRIPVQLVATNAPTGESTYWSVESEEQGEQAPIGLAQYLYQSMSRLEYEGTVATTQAECTGYITPGNVLNITGTQNTAHASMSARVQGVDELIDTGTTVVRFGPTPSLSLGSIIEFMRATRHRRRWTRTEVQESGENPSKTDVQLGQASANLNTVPGDQQNAYFALVNQRNVGKALIKLDAVERQVIIENEAYSGRLMLHAYDSEAEISCKGVDNSRAYMNANTTEANCVLQSFGGSILLQTAYCNGKTLKPREETWCNPDTGERKKIMIIASDPY